MRDAEEKQSRFLLWTKNIRGRGLIEDGKYLF